MNEESVNNIVKDIDCIQETQQHSVTIEHSWSIKDICDLISSKRPGEKIESEQFSYAGQNDRPGCKCCHSRNINAEQSKLSIIPSSYSLDFELACNHLINNSAWRLEIDKSTSDLNYVNINAVLFGFPQSKNLDDKIIKTIEKLTYSEYDLFLKIKFSILNDKINEIFDNNLLEIKIDLKKCLQQLCLRQTEGFVSPKKVFLIERYSIDKFFHIKNFLNWLNGRKSDDFCVITEFKLYRKNLSKAKEVSRSKLKPRVLIEKASQSKQASSLLILDFKHAWTIKNWRNFVMPDSASHTFLNDYQISSMFTDNQPHKLLNDFEEEFEADSIVQVENIKFGKFRSKLFFLIQTQKKVGHDCPNSKFNFDKNRVDSLLKEVKWKLQLYPNGYSQEYENNLSLFVNFSQLTGELSQFAPSSSKNKSFNSSIHHLNCNTSLEETFYDSNDDYGLILLIKSPSSSCHSDLNQMDESEVDTERKTRKKFNSCETYVKASFQISILDSNGKKVDKCQSEKQLFELFGSWGYKEYMNTRDLTEMKDKYLTNSNLNLNCKIILFYTVTSKISGSCSIDLPIVIKDDKFEIKNCLSSTSESASSSENTCSKQTLRLAEKQLVKKKRKSSTTKLNDYSNTLVYDLRRMFLNSEMSNLTIQAPLRFSESLDTIPNSDLAESNFKEFKVHKLILSSRSEVFFKMFSSDNLENSPNSINTLCIRDFDAFTVEIFLNYLYTDILEINFKNFRLNLDTCDPNFKCVSYDFEESEKSSDDEPNEKVDVHKELCTHIFAELFKIADKYCVHRLKQICESQLIKFIDKDNTVELLVISYLHNSLKLKKKCFGFLAENVSSVISQPSWALLEKSYPGLLAESFRALYFKKRENT